MEKKSPVQRYEDARALVAMEHPFFATIMFHVDHVATDDIPTMATDGKKIYYSPDFVNKLDDLSEIAGVIMHETCHIIFMHHIRAAELAKAYDGTLSNPLWQEAMDHAINLGLIGDGIRLPKAAYKDPKWEGFTSEEIYDRLIQSGDEGGKGLAIGDVMPAANEDGSPMNEEELTKARVDATSIVLQAGQAAKQMGRLPGWAKEYLDKLTESRADWREVLWRFVSDGRSFGFDWLRPSRRCYNKPYILPSYGAHGLPALNCIVDTSGSVSREGLRQFFSEVTAAAHAFDIDDVLVVQCDTTVSDVYQASSSDGDIIPPIKGRGGTDMNPAFQILARDYRPAPTILLSDMEIPPIQPHGLPVIYCRYGSGGITPTDGPVIDVT